MNRLLQAFLLLAAGAAAPPLLALLLVPLSIAELTAKSDLVLQGTVTSITVKRDQQGRIQTEIELDVAEVWKGSWNKPDPFKVVQGGGTLGDRRQFVSGQPAYRPGEAVVLFLALNSRGQGVTIGMAQGKFELQPTPQGEWRAHNLFHGGGPEALPHPHQHQHQHQNDHPHDVHRFPLALAELKRQVNQAKQ
jgi:hypothetical protein